MYINYTNDRRNLGFSCIKDLAAGNQFKNQVTWIIKINPRRKKKFLVEIFVFLKFDILAPNIVIFLKKVKTEGKKKLKKVVFSGILIAQLQGSGGSYLYHISTPLLMPINRVSPNYSFRFPTHGSSKISDSQIAHIIQKKLDKITLTNNQIQEFNDLAFQLNSGLITVDEAILQLRGCEFDLYFLVPLAGLYLIVAFHNYGIDAFNMTQNGLIPPYRGWFYGKNYKPDYFGSNKHIGPRSITITGLDENFDSKSSTSLGMERPKGMPEHVDSSLSKAERRQLADPRGRDEIVNIAGRPELVHRYNQSEFKTPKHGPLFGLPIGKNGLTPKTEKNVLIYQGRAVNIATSNETKWFCNGQYQAGTKLAYDSIVLLDRKTKDVVIYKKLTNGSGTFVSLFKATDKEIAHLNLTGNFVTNKVLEKQQWIDPGRAITDNNLSKSTTDFTPINNFENDLLGIIPINDLLGIIPIDDSQSNNQ